MTNPQQPSHDRVKLVLEQLETQLKQHDLWQSQWPSPEQLASTQPFAIDTLAFHQWLQFILLPRMHALVEGQHPLPEKFAVSPMATHVYRAELAQYRGLIQVLHELDILLSGEDPLELERQS